jgi:DNA (cytosine-5)-methyltransferase 1
MENVKGMLYFRLNGQQAGRRIVGGIEMGMMKFIYRTLIALGYNFPDGLTTFKIQFCVLGRYQVSFKVLQAAQYGAPQNRERVIIWAAKRGIPLPDFPIPTHFYSKAGNHYKVPTLCAIPPVSGSKNPTVTHQCAPFPSVTVNNAIGDLVNFLLLENLVLIWSTIASRPSIGLYSTAVSEVIF